MIKHKTFPDAGSGLSCHCCILPFLGVWELGGSLVISVQLASPWLNAILCEIPGERNVIPGIPEGKPGLCASKDGGKKLDS